MHACKANGNPLPKFEERAGAFVTMLKPAVEKTVEKTVEKILQLIAQNPAITQLELQQLTNLSRRGVEHNLKGLKASGRLIRQGGAKGGYWQVITP